jgi:hypothetical protein
MSVTSVIQLRVSNSTFSSTFGTAPSAGVDLEPWNVLHRLQGVVFSTCTFRNNSGVGIDVFLLGLKNSTETVDILFQVGGCPMITMMHTVPLDRCKCLWQIARWQTVITYMYITRDTYIFKSRIWSI